MMSERETNSIHITHPRKSILFSALLIKWTHTHTRIETKMNISELIIYTSS